LGGGSVIKPRDDGKKGVQLGPESMGSYPGPVCYDLGGDPATLTDAFVTAGLINPDYFLGGTKPIHLDLAREAIDKSVAQPLQLSVEGACKAVIDRAFEMVAEVIGVAQQEIGRDLSKHTLFAYGGNGGLFACGVADKAGLKSIQMFSLGPVFSAFGSSVSDISHVYERALPEPSISENTMAGIRKMVEEMKAEGAQDLLGEGIRPENVSYALEFEMSGKGAPSAPVVCSEASLRSAKDLEGALRAAANAPSGPIALDLIRLRVKKQMPKPRLTQQPLQAADSSHAHVGKRGVFWGSRTGEAQIYRWESLRPGNRVEGCGVVEGVNTTYFVPDGWNLTIDVFGDGKLNRE
jgi:N-methylhydantoinase A/oxoprolinase/acetone carboxylase beta subunit